MPIKTLKLGKMSPSYPSASLAPQMPEPEEYFPSLRLELPEGSELPDEGTMTIRYKINRETEDKKAGYCCVDLDVTEITAVKDETPKEDEYAGNVLDALRAEAEDKD